MTSGFLDVEKCRDVLEPFRDRWQELAAEAAQLGAGWLDGFGALYAPSGWLLAPVRYFGVDDPSGAAAAPLLAELVAQDGRLMTAMYLRLRGNTEIKEHRGLPIGIARYHMGLKVPENCAIEVGDTRRTWVEGEWLAFDDSLMHRTWNHSDEDRLVLQLDFEHPEVTVPRTAYAVRFLAGVYFQILRRVDVARRAVAFFNREIRGRVLRRFASR